MDWIAQKFPHFDEASQSLVRQAYTIAEKVLAEDVRFDGTPFIGHPQNVALIVSDEIGLPAACVAAVFLHEATRMHPEFSVALLGFPEEIRLMVDGLNKISTIKPKDTRLEAENYKRLIVQYSTDPRVTVLKIADRLEVMRNLAMFPKLSRERKILETLMLYIPLAHQLGLYNIKAEMEDIYFRFAEPEQYRAITNKLKATQRDREQLMEEFIEPLKKRLSDAGIHYKLKIRTKAAWSIYRKMVKQKVPFEGVYDVFAIRFIIDCDGADHATELKLCWDVYSYVTEEYESDTNRLRDWLTQPKANGYECLHITVKNRHGAYVEVQIRTKRMDDEAENGNAAHWSYKGIQHEAAMDKWLTSVRYALEHPSEANPEDLPEPPSREIFVFTPSGELRILPAGSSVLDFAFNIHSNIGLRCTGGKVGGKAVPIKHKLQTGDVIEILTGKNQKPSQDWLNFVVSSKARSKIRQVLHEAEHQQAAEGKELLQRRLKNWKLEFPDDMVGEFMKKSRFPSIKEMYAAIGAGTLDINVIKNFILEADARAAEALEAAREAEAAKARWKAEDDEADGDMLVLDSAHVKGLDYKMARCCNPVFGDDVFGFVTREGGIKIHRISCPNAARLIELYPYRIQKVRWAQHPAGGSFQATLRVSAAMESWVINQIMDVMNSFKTSLRAFNVSENPRSGTYDIVMKISVPSNMELDKVVSQLRNQKNVLKVSRS